MSWPIEYRIIVPCVTTTPIACGGNPNDVSDVDVRRNAAGQALVPGTSIAGALRQAFFERAPDREDCDRWESPSAETENPSRPDSDEAEEKESKACTCSTCKLFGSFRPIAVSGDDRTEQLASRIWVSDAVFFSEPAAQDAGATRIRIVDGVGISRTRRAAADAKKFDRTEVSPGACLDIEVRVENPNDEELDRLVDVLRLLAHGDIGLGRRTTEGLGRFQLRQSKTQQTKKKGKHKKNANASPQVDYRDLNRDGHLINSILHDTPPPHSGKGYVWLKRSKLSGTDKKIVNRLHEFEKRLARPPKDDATVIRVTLGPTDDSALLISDPAEAIKTGFDHVPRGGVNAAELPGSSVRGCLRSTVERILRTIVSQSASWPRVACRITDDPKINETTCGRPDDPKTHCCLACQMFGNTDWASRLIVNVEPIKDGVPEPIPFDHVSIDRFTGGARDQRKFNVLASRGRNYRVSFRIPERPGDSAGVDWMVALLALALRDLHDGYANLGAASSRGLARFQVQDIEWGRFDGKLDQCVKRLHSAIQTAMGDLSTKQQEQPDG